MERFLTFFIRSVDDRVKDRIDNTVALGFIHGLISQLHQYICVCRVFRVLNLLMGLTSMPVPVFMLATFLGMVPVLLILTYTGSQLGDIETFSMAAIFTPGVILSLVLLASFPFLARAIVELTRRLVARKTN